jgi:amidophosphoribosyltransferase
MGGLFGVVSREDCVQRLFYGTDYHSHLGTRRGGMAVFDGGGFMRVIHSIESAQFRARFEGDLPGMNGKMGIGCISDTDSQPLIVRSHLGDYAICTVGRINNGKELVDEALHGRSVHFTEMSGGEVSPTELIAMLIAQATSFEDGVRRAQEAIDGSCSVILLTSQGVYAARDRLGRTALAIGSGDNAYSVSMETCAFPNLGFHLERQLGPGEVVLVTPDGVEQLLPPGDALRICAFLWVYYGYPASSYEGVNVEAMRYRSGAALARNDNVEVDMVAGIPDSGLAHAIGYANQAHIPYTRPFVKYTPTWPRSFMPQDQSVRDLVARMKLIPIRDLIHGNRLLFCEDSIVRGTQLQDTIQLIYDYGAKQVHMRPACPPLIYGCRFLNFSRSRSDLDLAGRRAIREIEGREGDPHADYADPATDRYCAMVDRIRNRLHLTTLQYQTLPDMIDAIGLPKERVCTYCWDGVG